MVGLWRNMPPWLQALLEEPFFYHCPTHEATVRKSERNIFCLDCCSSLCPHCLPSHRHHRLLQIRRYVYQDVVRVEELEKLIECACIQSYTANGAKVVFLNERLQGRPLRCGAGQHLCTSCDRPLPEHYLYCCLRCKVKHLLRRDGELGRHLKRCDTLTLAGSPYDHVADDGQLSPDSVMGSHGDAISSGDSSGDGGIEDSSVRKRRSRRAGSGSGTPGSAGLTRRKKGVPCRAPLF